MATTFLQVKNNSFSTLSTGVDDAATVFPVSDVTKYPDVFPFHVTVDMEGANEIVKVAGKSGSNLDPCTRAQEGTTAVAHSSGVDVELLITAQQIADIHTAINALEALGAGYLLRDGSLPLTGDWDPGTGRTIGNYLHAEKGLSFSIGDANFVWLLSGSDPIVYFDVAENDYLMYNRGSGTWEYVVGGLSVLSISPSGIGANVINELTADVGVTIESVLLKDGRIAGSALPFAIYIPFGSEESYAP